ncbi:MAG TPA: branched-chain amino acid ABC transporter permease [Castellaniella sp.]|uniref:branched-chain amino acid ABC transporter permease n=1 Tax=Castellaniella sp. TaxID=1955812 RepID=UPI002F168627
MTLADFFTQFFGVVTSASLLFLVASGLTLIFGAMQIINIAHGSFYMFGAFIVASWVGASAGHSELAFWLAIIVAPILVGVLGALTEILVLRRLYASEHLLQLLATFGLLYLFEGIALTIWGGNFRSVSIPPSLQGHLAGVAGAVPVYDLFILAVAIGVGLFMWWLLQRTQLGWRIRAAVEDPEMLAVSGTNVSLLFTGVFALGAVLAAIAGVIVGPIQSVTTGLDTQILIEAFIVVVIGGLGSIPGAAIGALIIGLFKTVGVLWAPSFASASIYLAMILVLIIRPTGLLGVSER